MSRCECENWTLKELSLALQDKSKDNKQIVVPMFQRGKRWTKAQQKKLIDSLIKGYPVGTMLFYESTYEGKRKYVLVDGLQRGNSIKQYMNHPTDFFYDDNITDEECQEILTLVKPHVTYTEDDLQSVRSILSDFIKSQQSFSDLQYYAPAAEICKVFKGEIDLIGPLINLIQELFQERQYLYNRIASTVIPIVIYYGDSSNLHEIFKRINSQGTALDQYEIYAAAWPIDRRLYIANENVVQGAIKKYESFIDSDFIIDGYNRESMQRNKTLTPFEYLFGLSKYIANTYDMLAFGANLNDDTVNPIAFELVNACLNETDRIDVLYEDLYALPDINVFEEALHHSIEFVLDVLKPITSFKGNKQKNRQGKKKTKAKPAHSKYQVFSMISTTFKEMWQGTDYRHMRSDWPLKRDKLVKSLKAYYVYDILDEYWKEGGNKKIHVVAKPNRYLQDIPERAWNTVLEGFFDASMQRAESTKFAQVKSQELVFLNCIYLHSFTAMDQLSLDTFDVEHIAPKEQMKKLIKATRSVGLPVSSIANLCYLPVYVNRSKRDKNFYQDDTYTASVDIADVERKYSFTKAEDLAWMDETYGKGAKTADDLKGAYVDFCTKRFNKLKRKFCDSMGIDYAKVIDSNYLPEDNLSTEGNNFYQPEQDRPTLPLPNTSSNTSFTVTGTPHIPANTPNIPTGSNTHPNGNTTEVITINNPHRTIEKNGECTAYMKSKLEGKLGKELVKAPKSRSVFFTEDAEYGYVLLESKLGDRGSYFYAIRPSQLEKIRHCLEQYITFGFKHIFNAYKIPLSWFDDKWKILRTSLHANGELSHYHAYIYEENGRGYFSSCEGRGQGQAFDITDYKI